MDSDIIYPDPFPSKALPTFAGGDGYGRDVDGGATRKFDAGVFSSFPINTGKTL